MRLDTLKQNIKAQFTERVRAAQQNPALSEEAMLALADSVLVGKPLGAEGLHKALEEVLAAGLVKIDRWDVRSIGTLLSKFPEAAPGLAGRHLVMDMDSAGEWIVVRDTRRDVERALEAAAPARLARP